MLGAHCCHRLWCLLSSGLQHSFLENCGRWGSARGSHPLLKLSVFCIFPGFPLPGLLRTSALSWTCLFPCDQKTRSLRLPLGEDMWSSDWASMPLSLLPLMGPLHQHPPFAQPKMAVEESFITVSLSFSSSPMASLAAWHICGATFHYDHVLLSTEGVVTLQMQISGTWSSCLRTGQTGVFSDSESQKPIYLGFPLGHGSPKTTQGTSTLPRRHHLHPAWELGLIFWRCQQW